MAVRVPLFPSEPAGRYTVTLGAERFQLRFTWRDRPNFGRGGWYMDVFTQSGSPLVRGRRLSPDYAPLIDLLVDGAPAGYFLVRGPEPYTRDQLGTDVTVTYYAEADIPSPPASTLRVEV